MKLLIASEHGIVYKFMLLFKCWPLLLLFYIFVGSKSGFFQLFVMLKEVPDSFPFVGIIGINQNSPKMFSGDS